MRSSDGSSDVCSSDLQEIVSKRPECAGALARNPHGEREVRHVVQMQLDVARGDGGDLDEADLAQPIGAEIGQDHVAQAPALRPDRRIEQAEVYVLEGKIGAERSAGGEDGGEGPETDKRR